MFLICSSVSSVYGSFGVLGLFVYASSSFGISAKSDNYTLVSPLLLVLRLFENPIL